MSDFMESVDHMIARFNSNDAVHRLAETGSCTVKDWHGMNEILQQAIRTSIAHARKQISGRKKGSMSFEQAMQLTQSGWTMVTRSHWDIFRAIYYGHFEHHNLSGRLIEVMRDQLDAGIIGHEKLYEPSDEDLAATDWMLYQRPDENWVELDFD